MNTSNVILEDLTSVPASEQAIFRARIIHAANELVIRTGIEGLEVRAHRKNGHNACRTSESSDEKQGDDLRDSFRAREPEFTFDRVCLPERVREILLTAVSTIQHERKLFDEWGLSEIQAHARAALLLSGPPGTGKTAAAHGLASHLGLPILTATTADLESKFLGEGPKRVAAFFAAAREQNAVSFIDEADTLLGTRMSVTQGSERAANSMTSQLLIELEKHRGVIIFATNLLNNVDRAFMTRVLKIDIPLPGRAERYEIWKKHLPPRLPLKDIDIDALADIDGICGRDIRNAVILAAARAAGCGADELKHDDLVNAIQPLL